MMPSSFMKLVSRTGANSGADRGVGVALAFGIVHPGDPVGLSRGDHFLRRRRTQEPLVGGDRGRSGNQRPRKKAAAAIERTEKRIKLRIETSE